MKWIDQTTSVIKSPNIQIPQTNKFIYRAHKFSKPKKPKNLLNSDIKLL